MATRGGEPTPTAIKQLEGNPGKRRLNDREPRVGKRLLPARNGWSRRQRRSGAGSQKRCKLMGILTEVDMAAFTGYCQTYTRWKEAEEFITRHGTIVMTPSGYWQQIPQVSITQTFLKILNRFAEQFGLTPSSRSRIVADTSGRDNGDEMEALLGGDG